MLDESVLMQLKRDVGEEMFPLILAQFREEIEGKIKALQQVQQTQAIAELAELAHSMKSTSRTLGLMRLGDLASKVETQARAQDEAVWAQLEEFLQAASRGLQALAAVGD